MIVDATQSRHWCQVWDCMKFIVFICTTSVQRVGARAAAAQLSGTSRPEPD